MSPRKSLGGPDDEAIQFADESATIVAIITSEFDPHLR